MGPQHAEGAEEDEGQAVPFFPPDAAGIPAAQDPVEAEEEEAGQDQAGAGEPVRRDGAVREQVLAGDARGTPEDAAGDGHQDAAEMLVLIGIPHITSIHRFLCSIWQRPDGAARWQYP